MPPEATGATGYQPRRFRQSWQGKIHKFGGALRGVVLDRFRLARRVRSPFLPRASWGVPRPLRHSSASPNALNQPLSPPPTSVTLFPFFLFRVNRGCAMA